MPSRMELQQLAELRLEEAKVLLNKEMYDGSIYLAGYVVELALKARICKVINLEKYPDSGSISHSFKTHKLDDLLKLSGLEKELYSKENGYLVLNWSTITSWNETLRYTINDENNQKKAVMYMIALDNDERGIFNWIKRFW